MVEGSIWSLEVFCLKKVEVYGDDNIEVVGDNDDVVK